MYIDNQAYVITADVMDNGTEDDIVDVLLEDEAAYTAFLQENLQNKGLSDDSTEKLKNTTANDGILTFETEMKDGLFIRGFKKWLTGYLEYGAEHGSYAYEDGMTAKFEYNFDENTSDVIEWTCILCEKNGTEHLYKKTEMTYDTPYDSAMIPLITSAMDSEDLRNITITYADGQTVTRTVPKGVYVDVMVGGEYPEYLYIDDTYSDHYTWKNDDPETDMEFYLK